MSHLPAIFNYQDRQIRTFVINDEIYFVVVDVCKVLEIVNTTNAIDRLDPDGVRQAEVIDSLGRKQTATIANEPNLYRLIFRSDKPEAKAFQDWVYHEVLPSIRKTGSYSVSQELPNIAEIQAAYEQVRTTKERLTEATAAYREAQARFHQLIEPLGEMGKILAEQVSGQRKKPTLLATKKSKQTAATEEDKKRKLTEQWKQLLASAIAGKKAHLLDINGNMPEEKLAYGWIATARTTQDGLEYSYHGGGDHIGWIDGDNLYLDPHLTYKVVTALGQAAGNEITTSEKNLRKYLAQEKVLASTNQNTSRPMITIRIRLQGAQREVLHLKVSTFSPDDEKNFP